MTITYSPITDDDLQFLREVYKSTREEELKLVDWDNAKIEQFITQQFEAQHAYYQQVYCDATFNIIKIDNFAAGRLYIWESEKQIRIVDIALLPQFRGQGAGSEILADLISKSESTSKVVSIHVEYFNPALNLYNRLGFEKKDETGVYFYMERNPNKK